MESILKFGSVAALVAGLSLSASPIATAFEKDSSGHLVIEYSRDGKPKHDTNCLVLAEGYDLLCVHNLTDYPITKITCENWTTTLMAIPGGNIPSGHSTIIRFGKGKCSKHLKVYVTQKGTEVELPFDRFDVASNYELNVVMSGE